MKQYIVPAIKFLVFLGLGLLLSWLAVKDLHEEDRAQISKSIANANYTWIVLSMVAGLLAHFSRAIRWKMLLSPLGYTPGTLNTFYAVMIGYLGNLALPRPLGEVLRCGILKRYEKIPLTHSLGTVIAERIIDLVMLFLFLILSIWLEYQRMHAFISEHILSPIKLKMHSAVENKMILLLLAGALCIVLFAFFMFRKKIIQHALVHKVRTLLFSFLEGMKTVANLKSPLLFIFHSLFIWAMYALSVYVCVFAFEETNSMSLSDSLVLMTMGSLGGIITPGGIGAYQWIVLQVMLLWGYTAAMGVAFGWVVWIAQTALIALVGLLSFGLLAIGNKKD